MTRRTPVPAVRADLFEPALRALGEAWQIASRRLARRLLALGAFGHAYDGNEQAVGRQLDQADDDLLRQIETAAHMITSQVIDRMPDVQAAADMAVTSLSALRASTTYGYAYRGQSTEVRRRVAEVDDPTELLRMHAAAHEMLDALGPYVPTGLGRAFLGPYVPTAQQMADQRHAFEPSDPGSPEHGTCQRLGCRLRIDAGVHQ